MDRPLRVCIDARLADGTAGGIQQFVIVLAAGLSKLIDGNEQYLFLAHEGEHEWLLPYLGGNCEILKVPAPTPSASARVLDGIPGLRNAWNRISPLLGRRTFALPRSDGTIERAAADIMHFTLQRGFVTDVPSIYHPHDLQYLHLPQYFTPRHRMTIDLLFRALCARARMVAVTASWAKRDVIQHYGLAPEKVQVVPYAPPIEAYPVPTAGQMEDARRSFSLPTQFIFYPAQTFPHKNHLGLLEALALLRDRHGLRVPLISSGRKNEHYPVIERRVRELGLAEQVQFLGFVSPVELQCLYRLSMAVVIPTKFEAASFPLWEALACGKPVACSNVTSLPEQAGDAAIIFDPDNHAGIADAIQRLWVDESLRDELVKRGKKKIADFTLDRTARRFRAHYRRIAGRSLTDRDRDILDAPPLL